MSRRRVAVTGLGLVTPVGNTVAETWDSIIKGRSGVTTITEFDTSSFSVRIAASIKEFDPLLYVDGREVRRMDKFITYGLAAGIQAVKDCDLDNAGYSPQKVGVCIGSGIGGITSIEEAHLLIETKGPRRISPFTIPSTLINMISGHLSIRYGFVGPNLSVATACTTACHNIGLGARLIQCGDADVMLTGGAEFSISPFCLASFSAMRALSSRNDDPPAASRPWDRDRDGFVLGAGAGVLVLEEYESAKRRGAPIYAELAGFGMSGDGHHITTPPDNGQGALNSMRNALKDADLPPDSVDYINAHGTSTPWGDLAETTAVKALFGHDTKIPISSTKSIIGHLLGAAGAVEAAITVLSIKHNILTPTINLHNPDDGCDLDYVAHETRTAEINVALSNSFGFGGTNGTLLFRSPT